jgi:hypothetical protein
MTVTDMAKLVVLLGWYFSLDELPLVDVPTMIDCALEKTGASKLAFVGHSQVGGLLVICSRHGLQLAVQKTRLHACMP